MDDPLGHDSSVNVCLVQLMLEPGDLVVAHPKLAHRGGSAVPPDRPATTYLFLLWPRVCHLVEHRL